MSGLEMWFGWQKAHLACMEAWVQSLAPYKPGEAAHICNAGTDEMKTGESEAQH